MKVTQEKLAHSQVGLQIEVPAEQAKIYHEQAIQNLIRNANIPGFRKGKVPRQMIVQRFGAQQIKAMAIESLLEKILPEAIKEADVPALGNYQIVSEFDDLIANFKVDQPFTFKAAVDVPPEVKLGDYQKLKVTAEEEVAEADAVDKFLAERQREKSTLVPVTSRGAQLDDVAVVDYSGKTADGEEIKGAQATDAEVELSVDRFIADLVHGIVGMKIDEAKTIPVTFPADYAREDLAGQVASFDVTVKDLKTRELPDLSDDFAQEISEEATLYALRESLTKQFADRAADGTKSNIGTALSTALVEIVEVDPPETMIDQETGNILQMMAQQFSQYGMDVNQLFTRESIPKMKENCRPEAIKNLKEALAIAEIAKQEKISVEPAEIDAKCATIREQLQGDVIEDKLRAFVIEDMTKEKVLEWLQSKSEVTLVPVGSLPKEDPAEDEAVEVEAEVVAE
jgi:trigger factor